MNIFHNVKEAWKDVTKAEIVGWIGFVSFFSYIFGKYTFIWKMGTDKLEGSWLLYKMIMILVFLVIGIAFMKIAYKRISKGKNVAGHDELIRAFSGQISFSILLSLTLFVELILTRFRGSQWFEYLQGVLYMGVATGVGMLLYLIMINHVPRKQREKQEA